VRRWRLGDCAATEHGCELREVSTCRAVILSVLFLQQEDCAAESPVQLEAIV
jgi:hypothetical protein